MALKQLCAGGMMEACYAAAMCALRCAEPLTLAGSSTALLQVLSSNGFLYDGTILEEATNSISNGMGARTWPYTLQDGIPQNCGW